MGLEDVSLKGFGVTLLIVATATAWGGGAVIDIHPSQARPARSTETSSIQLAQAVVNNIYEDPRLINTCRYSPTLNLDVFADAGRTRRLFTLIAPNTQVILTGLTGTGMAQIKDPALGWVLTASVEPCTAFSSSASTSNYTYPSTYSPTYPSTESSTYSSTPSSRSTRTSTTTSSQASTFTPTPTPTPTSSVGTACFRVTEKSIAQTDPRDADTDVGFFTPGAIAYATTNPPTEERSPRDGRIWVQVYLQNGIGWIARTSSGSSDAPVVRLPDEQCQ